MTGDGRIQGLYRSVKGTRDQFMEKVARIPMTPILEGDASENIRIRACKSIGGIRRCK